MSPMPQGTLTYDNWGRKIEMKDPDMGVWTYSYDAAGNLIAQNDNNLKQTCFVYDVANRLTTKRVGAGNCSATQPPLAQYSYISSGNGLGQVDTVSWNGLNGTDSDSYSYDSQGRLTSHTRNLNGIPFTQSISQYDYLNRPTHILNGRTNETQIISYDRAGENRLETIVGGNTTVLATNRECQISR